MDFFFLVFTSLHSCLVAFFCGFRSQPVCFLQFQQNFFLCIAKVVWFQWLGLAWLVGWLGRIDCLNSCWMYVVDPYGKFFHYTSWRMVVVSCGSVRSPFGRYGEVECLCNAYYLNNSTRAHTPTYSICKFLLLKELWGFCPMEEYRWTLGVLFCTMPEEPLFHIYTLNNVLKVNLSIS